MTILKLVEKFLERNPAIAQVPDAKARLVDLLFTALLDFQTEERLLTAKAKAIEEGHIK
jgi:hypothetical protein